MVVVEVVIWLIHRMKWADISSTTTESLLFLPTCNIGTRFLRLERELPEFPR